MSEPTNIVECVRQVILRESEALQALADRVDDRTESAVRLILESQGRVIVTGMGKAGLIGRKAAATLCSTGTPASFLHPAEAIHGDLGLVGPSDLLIAMSNSGETSEVLALLPHIRRCGVPVLCLTGNPASTLANQSDVVLDVGVEEEADPDSPAPTCSTAAMLAMTDALSIAVMRGRGFTVEQFAIFHPGGHLGRKLLLKVEDLMKRDEALPIILGNTSLREAVMTMSRSGLGCAFVVDGQGCLDGILTDGDLRRILEHHDNPLDFLAEDLMTRNPKSIQPGALAAEALKLMEDNSITVLPVLDDSDHCIGALHLHSLVRQGLA